MKTTFSTLITLFITMLSVQAQNPITVVFSVNVAGWYIGPGGMHIAGQFATAGSTTITTDWEPAAVGSQMLSTGNGKYSIKVSFPDTSAGLDLQFLFVRNDIWNDYTEDYSEGNPGQTLLHNGCAVDDVCCGGFNRIITIPEKDAIFKANFDRCGELSDFSFRMDEKETQVPQLIIYPNPASEVITIAGMDEDAVVQITNLVGQVIWEGNISSYNPQVNVSELSSGSYFMNVVNRQVVRFNIER